MSSQFLSSFYRLLGKQKNEFLTFVDVNRVKRHFVCKDYYTLLHKNIFYIYINIDTGLSTALHLEV